MGRLIAIALVVLLWTVPYVVNAGQSSPQQVVVTVEQPEDSTYWPEIITALGVIGAAGIGVAWKKRR